VPGRIDPLPFDRAAGTSGLWAPKIRFWDPLNFTGALSAEQKARKRKAELKNGCAPGPPPPPAARRPPPRHAVATTSSCPHRSLPAQPPCHDRHGLVPGRPQPAGLRAGAQLGLLNT
jgi:hypothetical protein